MLLSLLFHCTDLQWIYYRVVKQNFQVDRFRDFGYIRAKMAQNVGLASKLNIFQLIQSKKLRLKAKTSQES